jgi:magnesium transporter
MLVPSAAVNYRPILSYCVPIGRDGAEWVMSQVTAAIFRDGKVIEHVTLDASLPLRGESEFIWIEMLDPVDSDFAVLQERFHLHCLAVEDSMGPAQAPKVDLYDDQIFVVLKTAHLDNDEIKYGEIDAFVGGHHVITVRHDACAERAHSHGKLRSGITPVQSRSDFILHGILDFAVTSYFPVVQMMVEEVFSMEQHLQDALLDRREINRLFRLRREAIHFQQVITRMTDVCGKLTHLDVPCIGAEVRPYFRDVHDHLMRLDGMARGLVDVIRTVFEASSLLEQQRQGIITRQLAAWAAILGVPTAIAAIYGITFPSIPGSWAPYGYGIVFGLMALMCVALFIRFKKLHWL